MCLIFLVLDLTFHHGKKKGKKEEEEAHKQVKKSIQFNYMIATFQDPEKLKAKNKAKISIT